MKRSLFLFIALILAVEPLPAGSKDLGNGFFEHGIASPFSNHRGTVATVDGNGRDIVLVWLFDHRGGYALLLIDAETGTSEEFPVPFPPGGDCPYASILSSRNRFYVEDPARNSVKESRFEYTSDGAHIMGVAAAPDGSISGGRVSLFEDRGGRHTCSSSEG